VSRFFIVMAALFGLSGVAAGALGAHGAGVLGDPWAGELLRTGSTYAIWHALAILAYLALGAGATCHWRSLPSAR
jgi:uncharacterized membrane protein YgdD (TMEM256/DUF423 family)